MCSAEWIQMPKISLQVGFGENDGKTWFQHVKAECPHEKYISSQVHSEK